MTMDHQPGSNNESSARQMEDGWLERNWKWAFPTGCLSMLLVFGGCMLAMYVGAIQAIKNTSPYKEAVELACADKRVVDLLGEPIQTGMLNEQAKIDMKDDESGTAVFVIPMEGSKASGKLFVDAQRTKDRKWTFRELTFRVGESPEVINLLNEDMPLNIDPLNIDEAQKETP